MFARYSEGLCKSRHVTSTVINATLLSSVPTHDIHVINIQIRFIQTYGAVNTVQTVQEVAIILPLQYSLHGLFVLGATAPSGPGPPHSRGF